MESYMYNYFYNISSPTIWIVLVVVITDTMDCNYIEHTF